jgi:hypothetical protein
VESRERGGGFRHGEREEDSDMERERRISTWRVEIVWPGASACLKAVSRCGSAAHARRGGAVRRGRDGAGRARRYRGLLSREQERRRAAVPFCYRPCISLDRTRWTGAPKAPAPKAPAHKAPAPQAPAVQTPGDGGLLGRGARGGERGVGWLRHGRGDCGAQGVCAPGRAALGEFLLGVWGGAEPLSLRRLPGPPPRPRAPGSADATCAQRAHHSGAGAHSSRRRTWRRWRRRPRRRGRARERS